MRERRRYLRIPVAFPIEYTIASCTHLCYETVSKDLSACGTRVISDIALPEGTPISLCINLINQTVKIFAQVKWCKQEHLGRYSLGLGFSSINADLETYMKTSILENY